MNLYLRCFWLHQRRNFKNVLHILSEDVENQWWSCIIFFVVAQIFKCSSVTKTVLKWMRGDLLPNLKVVSEEQVLSTSQPEKQHRIARLPPHGPFWLTFTILCAPAITFVPWKNLKNIVMGVLILIRLETHRAYTLHYWFEAQWPISFQSDGKNITVKRSIRVKIHCLPLLWYSLQNYCINTYGWVTFHCYISQLLVILLLSVLKVHFVVSGKHFNQKYIT